MNNENNKKMKEMFNGCPLFEGREKGSLDELTGKEISIMEYFRLADYHAVVFNEYPDRVYLSCASLDKLITEFADDCKNVKIKFLTPIKTADKHDYRPLNIVD